MLIAPHTTTKSPASSVGPDVQRLDEHLFVPHPVQLLGVSPGVVHVDDDQVSLAPQPVPGQWSLHTGPPCPDSATPCCWTPPSDSSPRARWYWCPRSQSGWSLPRSASRTSGRRWPPRCILTSGGRRRNRRWSREWWQHGPRRLT